MSPPIRIVRLRNPGSPHRGFFVDGRRDVTWTVLILVKGRTSIQPTHGVPGTTRTSGRRSMTTARSRKSPIFCVGRLHKI
jgi:hypothetical protein